MSLGATRNSNTGAVAGLTRRGVLGAAIGTCRLSNDRDG